MPCCGLALFNRRPSPVPRARSARAGTGLISARCEFVARAGTGLISGRREFVARTDPSLHLYLRGPCLTLAAKPGSAGLDGSTSGQGEFAA